MKFVFVDAEFTGEHINATLVSLSMVGMQDEHLTISFNDYDQAQVTPWLQENVLPHVDHSRSMTRREAIPIIAGWLSDYSAGQQISLVSAGKQLDLMLLFELWHLNFPERDYFHYLDCLPPYLNHAAHFDLPTIFFLAGVDPNCDREEFINHRFKGHRHESLYDARVVRECFKRCVVMENFPRLKLDVVPALHAEGAAAT